MEITCADKNSELCTDNESSEVRSSICEGINEASDELFCRGHECESKASLEKAQQSVEFYHNRSKEQILELHGAYISDESYERIENGVDYIEAVRYNPDETCIGSFYYHNGETHISVCNIDPEQLESTTQHETNHFMSFNIERQELVDDTSMDRKYYKKSGIHESEYIVDQKNHIKEVKDLNRGFNEGITQMYTNRQLGEIAQYKGELAARQNGYQFATELSEQVEDILGKDFIAKAYYGGELGQLKEEINRLGGKGSFERLSKDMDKAVFSSDYVTRLEAMKDAQELMAAMSEGGSV